jgi:hypothetical protein
MTSTAGYSGTPLTKKLGIKNGMSVIAIHAPENYRDLLAPLPDGVTITDSLSDNAPFIHCFCTSQAELKTQYEALKAALAKDGLLWISWYKKAAKIPTDLTEDVIRDMAIAGGLVDVKVCAVDAKWSGLKLVYRKVDR